MIPISAVAAFIARSGMPAAIKKYGRQVAMAAGKNRKVKTAAERKSGRFDDVPTKKNTPEATKMPGGTSMPAGNYVDKAAGQAARRAANEASQLKRGVSRLKKGAAFGAGAAGAGATIAGAGTEEFDRMRKIGQRSAFGQAGKREVDRAAEAKAAADKAAAKKKAEQERAKLMSTNTVVTARRSDVDKARNAISGPNARPIEPVVPPTNPESDLGVDDADAPKGDRRTPTVAIVGEKSTGASGAKDNPKTVGEYKNRGSDTFIGKDGKKKAAVTKEELEASGLSLRDYLNKQKGLTRKNPVKKSMGGKVRAYSSGGSVRGSGCATKGVRAAKMVTMKGA